MNIPLSDAFAGYPEDARVWIFQTVMPWNADQETILQEAITGFLASFKAHRMPVRASVQFFSRHFIVLAADEHVTPVSGCAGDALHHMIQNLGHKTGLDFFNRLVIPVLEKGGDLRFMTKRELQESVRTGSLPVDVRILDHSVRQLRDWRSAWIRSYKDSWLMPRDVVAPD